MATNSRNINEVLEKRRKTAVRTYLCLSLVQFALGASSLVCAVVAIKYKSSVKGVPYYTGGFINGTMLLASSLLSFRIYNKGPLFSSSLQARKEVMCAVNWQRLTSFSIFFTCIIGLAIIWMYGLCIEKDKQCSYEEFHRQNHILATTCFVLGAIGFLTSGVGIVIVRKYGIIFGVIIVSDSVGAFLSFRDDHSQDIVNHLRRENAALTRRTQVEEDNNPYIDGNGNEQPGFGFANFGFEPCELPPYSPRSETSGSQPEVVSPSGSNVAVTDMSKTFYSSRNQNIPNEPPPPYTEAVPDNHVTNV